MGLSGVDQRRDLRRAGICPLDERGICDDRGRLIGNDKAVLAVNLPGLRFRSANLVQYGSPKGLRPLFGGIDHCDRDHIVIFDRV